MEPDGRITEVWRDDSAPAFTADTPDGSHAAWWFSVGGRDFGPYYTRHDAEEAAKTWHRADSAAQRETQP